MRQIDVFIILKFGSEIFGRIPLNWFNSREVEMSRKSSGTTFEPTGTISGPIFSSEPSIHVSGTPFDRFRGYF